MSTADPSERFELPFPNGGMRPSINSCSQTYSCQPAPGIWARVVFDREAREVRLSFWDADLLEGKNFGHLIGPREVIEDPTPIVIMALIHNFIATHQGNQNGKRNP